MHYTVKVYTTTCSSINTPGPSWYRLEAISQETETLEGVFEEPPLRSEALLVNNNDVSLLILAKACMYGYYF